MFYVHSGRGLNDSLLIEIVLELIALLESPLFKSAEPALFSSSSYLDVELSWNVENFFPHRPV